MIFNLTKNAKLSLASTKQQHQQNLGTFKLKQKIKTFPNILENYGATQNIVLYFVDKFHVEQNSFGPK